MSELTDDDYGTGLAEEWNGRGQPICPTLEVAMIGAEETAFNENAPVYIVAVGEGFDYQMTPTDEAVRVVQPR